MWVVVGSWYRNQFASQPGNALRGLWGDATPPFLDDAHMGVGTEFLEESLMNRYLAASTAFAFLSTVIVAASGCSAPSEEDLGSAEGAAPPANPSGNYALAETCSRLFKRHEVVHDLDLEVGTIRWACGDVPGVTDPDLGQEY